MANVEEESSRCFLASSPAAHSSRGCAGSFERVGHDSTERLIEWGSAPAGGEDMRRVLLAASLVLPCLLLAACEDRNPVGPTSSATLDRFVQVLRQQGLSVSLAGQISPDINHFFSVPAQQARVNDAQVNTFVYHKAEAA